jgi:hypothetical protein
MQRTRIFVAGQGGWSGPAEPDPNFLFTNLWPPAQDQTWQPSRQRRKTMPGLAAALTDSPSRLQTSFWEYSAFDVFPSVYTNSSSYKSCRTACLKQSSTDSAACWSFVWTIMRSLGQSRLVYFVVA